MCTWSNVSCGSVLVFPVQADNFKFVLYSVQRLLPPLSHNLSILRKISDRSIAHRMLTAGYMLMLT